LKKYLLVILLTIVLAVALGVSGCAKNTQQAADTKSAGSTAQEFIIVNHTSLTGGLADCGFAAKTGVDLAAKDLGSTVKIGGKEYKVKVLTMDDKGETGEAAVVAQNAIDKGAVGVIGCLTSGNTNAALPVYKKEDIAMISPSSTRPDLTDVGHTNFFRTCLRDDLQGKVIGDWAAANGYKKVTVVDDSGDYAKALGDVVEKTLKDKGVSVKREHATDDKQDNFSAQIGNIKAFGSKCVIFTGYHRQAGLLRKQMIEANLKKVAFMGGDGAKSEELFKEAGGKKNVEGMMVTFGLDRSQMSGYDKFQKEYKDTTGKDPGPYAENAYDAFGMLIGAMKDAGTTDGKAVIASLKKIKYKGIIGEFSFAKKGDIQIKGGVSQFVIKDGKFVPVAK
jgi:branched-chain amino acid transport system substrate-binding protein